MERRRLSSSKVKILIPRSVRSGSTSPIFTKACASRIHSPKSLFCWISCCSAPARTRWAWRSVTGVTNSPISIAAMTNSAPILSAAMVMPAMDTPVARITTSSESTASTDRPTVVPSRAAMGKSSYTIRGTDSSTSRETWEKL